MSLLRRVFYLLDKDTITCTQPPVLDLDARTLCGFTTDPLQPGDVISFWVEHLPHWKAKRFLVRSIQLKHCEAFLQDDSSVLRHGDHFLNPPPSL